MGEVCLPCRSLCRERLIFVPRFNSLGSLEVGQGKSLMNAPRTCTCICNLQSFCRLPYEYFYGVILTPKLTIRIIIYSLPVIIEKDNNYNAISMVSYEYFFFSVTHPNTLLQDGSFPFTSVVG